MSSVSAACIFGAYNASSAHTDTFYIVSQIVRVRNSKRHFFSKLTFPYIIQPLCFTLRPHRPQPLHFALRPHRPQPLRLTLLPHRPQPPCLRPTATSTTVALPSPYGNIDHSRSASPYGNIDHNRSVSPYGHIDHSRSASPYGRIDHNHLASPYGHIDHSLSFRTTKPFEQLCRKFFVFF